MILSKTISEISGGVFRVDYDVIIKSSCRTPQQLQKTVNLILEIQQ